MSAGSRYLGGAPPLPSTEDGFRSAGDIGYLDEDGYLYIVDRRVDMIITGGANVFPAEVESALAGHPGIADVVVIGLSYPQWGRRVHAVVQLADADRGAPLTERQVIEYAKSRLAHYKAPKTVEFVDAIPRTAATKVNRSAAIGQLFSYRLSRCSETEDWAIDTIETVAAEVAAALRIGQGLAASRARYARAMRERLPQVGEVFNAGHIVGAGRR